MSRYSFCIFFRNISGPKAYDVGLFEFESKNAKTARSYVLSFLNKFNKDLFIEGSFAREKFLTACNLFNSDCVLLNVYLWANNGHCLLFDSQKVSL